MRAVWLVARREIRERVKARSFRIATVVSILLVVAAITVPKVTGGKTPTYDVGVVGTAFPIDQLQSLEPALDVKLKVHTVATVDEARRRIKTETLDVAIADDALVTKRVPGVGDGSKSAQLVAALSNLVRFQRIATIAGPQAIAALSAPVKVTGVEPPEANVGDRVTAFFGVLLLFAFLQQYGTWVLMGVIEEKASRVVEVLLSATSPWRLLAGKVLGIGSVATMQGLLVALAALVTANATGADVFHGSSQYTIVWSLIWFVLGYSLYAWIYAAVGSLCSRQSDAQNAAFPIFLPLLVSYISTTTLIGGGTPSAFHHLLAIIPFTAPMMMPMLIGIGAAPVWQIVLSLALTGVALFAMVRIAGGVYARAILHTGQRLRFRQVLRRDFSAA